MRGAVYRRGMRDENPLTSKAFYEAILELGPDWLVEQVLLNKEAGEVEVLVSTKRGASLPCPECSARCSVHDRRKRSWRHLDTCQLRTIVTAMVPRVRCAEHGVKRVAVPWAEGNARFTALFESVVIDWLLEASISAVAEQMQLTWDQVAGIQARAVKRGLERRAAASPRRLAIDETSFQKRHEYVTIVSDVVSGHVLYVADNRRKESLAGYFDALEPAELLEIEAVSMDMWAPYISVVEHYVHDAERKICFDKFHVAQHLGDAVDKVRRREHRELVAAGNTALTGSRYTWLRNPENMTGGQTSLLERLKRVALRTARAWAIKEHAMCLWSYVSRGWAKRAWTAWLTWAERSRLEPIKAVARLVRRHLDGIINAIVLRATNASAESINSRIQKVKRMSHGFRNRERFRNAIYFHLGGLELHP